MRLTSGCCAGIRITEKGKYLTLEFCGEHHARCHDDLLVKGSRPGLSGFRPYSRSEGASEDVDSGMLDIGYGRFGVIHLPLRIAAQTDTNVMFVVLPPMSRQLLFVHQFRQLQ